MPVWFQQLQRPIVVVVSTGGRGCRARVGAAASLCRCSAMIKQVTGVTSSGNHAAAGAVLVHTAPGGQGHPPETHFACNSLGGCTAGSNPVTA